MKGEAVNWRASGEAGAVAAGGSEAVAAGASMLEQDGNAADAAVATLFALMVTDYGAFASGGEIPVIHYDASREKTEVLCGAGGAPLDQTAIDWYYAHQIPDQGSYQAMPVPGAVHLCLTLLELRGTKSFAEVLAPTLALLDAEEEWWHPRLAATFRRMVDAGQGTSGSREEKVRAARDRFYRGDIADGLVAWYKDVGSFLRKRDLRRHVTTIEEPVSIRYRDYTVHKCSTWTQGPVLCQVLRLLEGYDLQSLDHLSADYIHLLTEAMKLAYADRDEYYGDPAFADVPLAALVSEEYAAVRRELLDMQQASWQRRVGNPRNMEPLVDAYRPDRDSEPHPNSDTTTCVVADRWGNVVSATPSCNLLTNEPDPKTGVTQGNRVRSLNTTPAHPNRVQAGKRPRITLTPTMVTRDGKPVLSISVAGGDLQDQTTLNILLNHIEFGMMPDEAVTQPRFNTDHMQDSFDADPDRDQAFKAPGSLRVNSEVPDVVRAELQKRGHDLSTTSEPIASPVMLHIDPQTGTIHAAGDPKAGRHAAAL
ncbi:MAG: gamma-glutamyltransferase [Armatimonadota bacterium]